MQLGHLIEDAHPHSEDNLRPNFSQRERRRVAKQVGQKHRHHNDHADEDQSSHFTVLRDNLQKVVVK